MFLEVRAAYEDLCQRVEQEHQKEIAKIAIIEETSMRLLKGGIKLLGARIYRALLGETDLTPAGAWGGSRCKSLSTHGSAPTIKRPRTSSWSCRRFCNALGWEIAGIYEDVGISGSKGRDKRPGFDRLLKDATKRKFDMIAAWSVDRLGRSIQHLISFLTDLQALGCNLYLHQQALGHQHAIRSR